MFLGKLIDLHNANSQGFWVELCQQIETGVCIRFITKCAVSESISAGLFSITSIGLIPWRIVDSYSEFTITVTTRTRCNTISSQEYA